MSTISQMGRVGGCGAGRARSRLDLSGVGSRDSSALHAALLNPACENDAGGHCARPSSGHDFRLRGLPWAPICRGRMLYEESDFHILATDLRAFAKTATDEDFDRAVRRGLTPRARALWVMPADAYVYMKQRRSRRHHRLYSFAAARQRAHRRAATSGSPQGWRSAMQAAARLALHSRAWIRRWMSGRAGAAGGIWRPSAVRNAMAAILTGDDARFPISTSAADYSRADFFHLMHGGKEKNGKLTQMSAVAGARFSALLRLRNRRALRLSRGARPRAENFTAARATAAHHANGLPARA